MFSLHDLQGPSKHRVTAKRCDNLWNCWIPSPCQLMPALFLRARGLERQFFFRPNFSSAWCLVLHKKSHVWDKSLAGIHGLCPSCLGSHGSRANSKQTAESDVTNLGIYPGLNNRCMFYCCLFHCFSFYSFPACVSLILLLLLFLQTIELFLSCRLRMLSPFPGLQVVLPRNSDPVILVFSLCTLPNFSFTFSTLQFCTISPRNARNPFQPPHWECKMMWCPSYHLLDFSWAKPLSMYSFDFLKIKFIWIISHSLMN